VSAKPGATTAPAGKPAAAKSTSPDAVKTAPEVAKSAAERVTAQAPKIMSAPGAKAAQPEPVEAAAPKRGRPPKMTSVENPVPTVAHTAEPAAAIATSEGSKTMNETVTKVQDSAKKITNEAAGLTQEAAGRTQALFGEITERAKSSYEKGVQLAEEISEFSKGNVEAFVESSKVAAKGVESLSQEAADYARKTLENSTSAFKTFASAKSPTEFFRLQSDYAKSYFDNAVAESSKITEAWLKLAGDVAQPLSNRYAVAVEKIKQVAA
jgi:phasin family protein